MKYSKELSTLMGLRCKGKVAALYSSYSKDIQSSIVGELVNGTEGVDDYRPSVGSIFVFESINEMKYTNKHIEELQEIFGTTLKSDSITFIFDMLYKQDYSFTDALATLRDIPEIVRVMVFLYGTKATEDTFHNGIKIIKSYKIPIVDDGLIHGSKERTTIAIQKLAKDIKTVNLYTGSALALPDNIPLTKPQALHRLKAAEVQRISNELYESLDEFLAEDIKDKFVDWFISIMVKKNNPKIETINEKVTW